MSVPCVNERREGSPRVMASEVTQPTTAQQATNSSRKRTSVHCRSL